MYMVVFKSVKLYGLYALFLFILLIAIFAIEFQLKLHGSTTFQVWPELLFGIIAYPFIGGIIGGLHLIKERRKKGKWRVNIGKIMIIGLPAMYLAYYPFIYFSNTLHFLSIPNVFLAQAIISGSAPYICRMLLGYIIVTSFYKE